MFKIPNLQKPFKYRYLQMKSGQKNLIKENL